jgi:hypothetical protein
LRPTTIGSDIFRVPPELADAGEPVVDGARGSQAAVDTLRRSARFLKKGFFAT